MKPLITNIQRFCVHDGPGIRTTVFFKGCSLHCPWCANPENINFIQQYFIIKEKCKKSCVRTSCCKFYSEGIIDKEDVKLCNYGVFKEIGSYYSEEELYNELVKDLLYYQGEGGVTFSGGEALLGLKKYEAVIKRLHIDDINVCVETALFVPIDSMYWAVKYIDLFYVDIKLLDKDKCKNILGGDIDVFLRNIKYLYDNITPDRLIYRIPLVRGVTCTKDNLEKIVELIKKYPPLRVEIFSVHNLGAKKYECLNQEYYGYSIIDDNELIIIKDYLEKKISNICVVINKL